MKLHAWLLGWCEIAVGLARILTLGHWAPRWDLRYIVWHTRRKVERMIKESPC